jgi:hypothetical protein
MRYHKQLIKDELSIIQARATSNAEHVAERERLLADRERRHAEKARLEIDRITAQTAEMKEAAETLSKRKLIKF